MICLAADSPELVRRRRLTAVAMLTAVAVAVHTLEFLLPAPAPWFRLGFANILTLCALFLMDARAAWSLTLGRVVIGSLVLGSLFAPAFLLSLAGALVAVATMSAARRLLGDGLGPVGVSALGACAHALGQLAVARWLLVRHEGLWLLLPVFLLLSLLTGLLNGWIAAHLIAALRRHPVFSGAAPPPPSR